MSKAWKVGIAAEVLFLLACGASGAGECLCSEDFYLAILLDRKPAKDLDGCDCDTPHRGCDPVESLGCLYSLSYRWSILEAPADSSAAEIKLWNRTLEALRYTYTKRPALRARVIQTLFTSQAYLDRKNRAGLRKLVAENGQAELWDSLTAAASGDRRARKRAFYQYCGSYQAVVELFSAPESFQDVWPPPPGVGEPAARRSLNCPFMQEALLKLAIQALDTPLGPTQIKPLTGRSLRYLRNAVFARHGRLFESKKLTEYFSWFDWYHPDPTFDDMRLTDLDRKNLDTLLKEQSSRR